MYPLTIHSTGSIVSFLQSMLLPIYSSLWKICGIKLPEGLKESEKLPEPIYTPSTKAEIGDHDENISFEKSIEVLEKQFPGKGLEYATGQNLELSGVSISSPITTSPFSSRPNSNLVSAIIIPLLLIQTVIIYFQMM